jgi:hypothetical protein
MEPSSSKSAEPSPETSTISSKPLGESDRMPAIFDVEAGVRLAAAVVREGQHDVPVAASSGASSVSVPKNVQGIGLSTTGLGTVNRQRGGDGGGGTRFEQEQKPQMEDSLPYCCPKLR